MNANRNIPLLLIIFNRPDKVRTLVAALEKARPSRVFIAADGARANVPGEKERCAEARAIATSLSWPCEIETRFSDKNLGCKIGVSTAIDWFFSRVDEGIVLEDDCIPDPSFFSFCGELLERYRTDDRVMHIGGTTFLDAAETSEPGASYHFSRIAHIWGWATWKRAWEAYDIDMKGLDGMKKDFPYARYWIGLFKHVRDKKIDTWDAQWAYSIRAKGGLAITPQTNLIENIGFDADATHTHTKNKDARAAEPIRGGLVHPQAVQADEKADANLMKKVYIKTFWQKIRSIIG